MSITKLKKEISELIQPFTKGNKETNQIGKIIGDAQEIAKKYNYYIEDIQPEHIDYGTTLKNKIQVLNDKNKSIGTISLNVFRNEHGTYEYTGYFSGEIKRKLKP